jgi:hypothetical protein
MNNSRDHAAHYHTLKIYVGGLMSEGSTWLVAEGGELVSAVCHETLTTRTVLIILFKY